MPGRSTPCRQGPRPAGSGDVRHDGGCLQSSAELGARRDLGASVHRLAGPGGRHRGPELGGVRRLHRRSSTSACGRSPQKGAPANEPADHAIGRSRGGLTTKIHLAADGNCRPLAFVLTAGQARDAPAFTDVMARLRTSRTPQADPSTEIQSGTSRRSRRFPEARSWPTGHRSTRPRQRQAARAATAQNPAMDLSNTPPSAP
ncbi:MAG: hypothetical protein V7646_190 [Pseudonocardia sp.]